MYLTITQVRKDRKLAVVYSYDHGTRLRKILSPEDAREASRQSDNDPLHVRQHHVIRDPMCPCPDCARKPVTINF